MTSRSAEIPVALVISIAAVFTAAQAQTCNSLGGNVSCGSSIDRNVKYGTTLDYYSGPTSLGSSYPGLGSDLARPAERPGMIGGIVISGGTRRCAGLFRAADC